MPSGEEALERFAARPYDLLITDIRMAGMSGIDLLKEVKRLYSGTEVIVMTSYASLETAVSALRAGAYDYLIKPFEELDLVTAAVSRAAARAAFLREMRILTETIARKNEELQAANRALADRVNRDGLTGLYNHAYFQDALRQEVSRSARHGYVLLLLFATSTASRSTTTGGAPGGGTSSSAHRGDPSRLLPRVGRHRAVRGGGVRGPAAGDPIESARAVRSGSGTRSRGIRSRDVRGSQGDGDRQSGPFLLPGKRQGRRRADPAGGRKDVRGQEGRGDLPGRLIQGSPAAVWG